MSQVAEQSEEKKLVKRVPASERLLLDTLAAADMLSVSPNTLEKLPIPRYRIPATNCVRWRMADLEIYARSLIVDSPR